MLRSVASTGLLCFAFGRQESTLRGPWWRQGVASTGLCVNGWHQRVASWGGINRFVRQRVASTGVMFRIVASRGVLCFTFGRQEQQRKGHQGVAARGCVNGWRQQVFCVGGGVLWVALGRDGGCRGAPFQPQSSPTSPPEAALLPLPKVGHRRKAGSGPDCTT